GLLAVRILATADETLQVALNEHRENMKEKAIRQGESVAKKSME
ncbi:MAG: hypothetical protein RIS09_169, partial [Actinomycetota bacterium]